MFRTDVSYPAFVQIMEEHAGSGYSERRIANVSWVTSQSCRRIGDHVSETEAEQTAVPLDDVDRDIIRELTTDGRMSITQVAENVHISRAHAYSRIARLTGEGVLTKFTALVDPIKAGLRSSAYVTLKVQQHSWRELKEHLRAIPEVHHIALVGGDFDVILLVRATDNIHLRRVIFDQLQSMEGVLDTQTFLVFEDVDTR
jgi:DNA-binding Lrp family transcriptional regulator